MSDYLVRHQNVVSSTPSSNVSSTSDDGTGSVDLEAIKFYLATVVNPGLCVFGVLGNVFNVMVLSRSQIKATLECSMELAAHTGLMALAVSDILYCVSAFLDAVVSRQVISYYFNLLQYTVYNTCTLIVKQLQK